METVAMELDALLVLGGEDRQHMHRTSAALRVYRDHGRRGAKLPKLIVSGATVVWHQDEWLAESALMAQFLWTQGVPLRDILVESQALDTFGNVVLGGEMAARQGLSRIAIVTDDFHHRRSRQIFRRVFGIEPQGLLATGVKGTVRARIRERLSYWALAAALKSAGVARGDPRAHKAFLMKKQNPLQTLEPDAHRC